MDYKTFDIEGENIMFVPDTFSIICLKDRLPEDVLLCFDRLIKKSVVESVPHTQLLELDFCITRRCNLACDYCYANQFDDGSPQELTLDIAKKAVDFFYKRFGRIKWKVDFIGQGEPLLRYDIIIEIVNYIKNLKNGEDDKFLVITNGTLLFPNIFNALKENDVSVAVSIDGAEEAHNTNRHFKDGSGSYSIVKRNLSLLNFQGNNIWGMSVIDGKNDMCDIIRANSQLGFRRLQMKIVRISGNKNRDRRTIYMNLCKQYEKYFAKLKDDLLHNRTELLFAILNETDQVGKILRNLLTCQKAFRRCKAGFSRFSIATNGDIYPCSNFYSVTENKLGNILQGNLDDKASRKFSEINIDSDKLCCKCWCRYMCGGKCKYSSFMEEDLDINYDCLITEKICEESIKLLYQVKRGNRSILKRIVRFAQLNLD